MRVDKNIDIDKNTFEKVIWHLNIWQLLGSYINRVRQKYKIQNKKQIMSGVLHESWLAEVFTRWDRDRKLNAFEDCYCAWILLLQDETLVQEMKYLASHFCCFFGIMLHRNLEYFHI